MSETTELVLVRHGQAIDNLDLLGNLTANCRGLTERGHLPIVSGAWSLGRLSAVSRDPATGVLRAGANPRAMQGYAAGR